MLRRMTTLGANNPKPLKTQTNCDKKGLLPFCGQQTWDDELSTMKFLSLELDSDSQSSNNPHRT